MSHRWGGGGILKVGTLSFFVYLIIVITAHACGEGGGYHKEIVTLYL